MTDRQTAAPGLGWPLPPGPAGRVGAEDADGVASGGLGWPDAAPTQQEEGS